MGEHRHMQAARNEKYTGIIDFKMHFVFLMLCSYNSSPHPRIGHVHHALLHRHCYKLLKTVERRCFVYFFIFFFAHATTFFCDPAASPARSGICCFVPAPVHAPITASTAYSSTSTSTSSISDHGSVGFRG